METDGKNAPDSPVQAVATIGRIAGFDIARSFALLGMIVVHFSLVMAADHSSPGWMVTILGFLDGRAAATFVILAGVGLTLRSQRATAHTNPKALAEVRWTLIRRGLFLLVVGFLNLRIWQGDILRVYGISLLLAARLLNASNRRLLFGALAYALGFVILFVLFDYEKNWNWSTLTYRRLWTPSGSFRNLFYDGFRSIVPWTGFVYFGMWLGRLDLRNIMVNNRVLLSSIGVALFAEGTSRLCVWYLLAHPHGMDAETIKALSGTESMPPLPLFLLAGGGTAVAVIALSVRLAARWPTRLWRPLIDTGQMAFTWYFGHIILGLGTVEALGLVSTQSLPRAAGCGVLFFALAILLSWLWKKIFRHGPLEWVMRKVAG
ncbi:MAG TPA: DUF418 domain-containing protein [Gemmataceae bacterium]|nr:DUF418 domain-containing protein [Gemmataceae bacterium]